MVIQEPSVGDVVVNERVWNTTFYAKGQQVDGCGIKNRSNNENLQATNKRMQ